MATTVPENLEKILSARYGEEVRGAIHDSIKDIYEYSKSDLSAFNIDYSRMSNLYPNLIDTSRIVRGKQYGENGLFSEANHDSLSYLIPVKNGDIIYQRGGYCDLHFYGPYGNHVYDARTTDKPYTVESDESVAFVGVSISTASGSKMDDRVLRVNHPLNVDYSMSNLYPNLIDTSRIVRGKQYGENGLFSEANHDSLSYLIPVKNGDIIYQRGGYCDLHFYGPYGNHVYDAKTTDKPYTVESDESVAFVGVSISTASGSKMDDRVLRVNHPPMDDYVNGNTDWFVWANNNDNDSNDSNDDKTVVLLDFDQVPTEETDLRFSIMDEYGWTATTPVSFFYNDMNDYILSKGWSLSIYQAYSDPETMISNGNDDGSYNDFKTYIDDAFSEAYNRGFFSPIQWSAARNYIGSNLIKALKTKGIPLIRGNYFDPSKDIEDDGRIVKLQANPMSKSNDLSRFKSIITTGKYKVINIFAHRILPDATSDTDPICTPESVYRSFCEYLKSLEEDGSVLVTNSTKWFSKAFPDRVRAYEDVWIRAMYKHLSK